MSFRSPHFRAGVVLTVFLALAALQLDHAWSNLHAGPLSLALVLGMLAKKLLPIPQEQEKGIHFSSKQLLRIGIVLLGVRLNFILLLHAGGTIFILTSSIVIGGLLVITWLGRCFNLPSMLSLLIAIDSSICGASAVAALAPTLGAQEEIAFVIPLCSFIGMIGMMLLGLAQHLLSLTPRTFGLLAGATLHEVAQVIATVSLVPAAMEVGTITKLMRVLLLAPVMLGLSWIVSRKPREGALRSKKIAFLSIVTAMWFVLGFLVVGSLNTLLLHCYSPALISNIDEEIMTFALFLMTMAMAGMGLQVNMTHFYRHGLRSIAVAFLGWFFLVSLAAIEIYFLK